MLYKKKIVQDIGYKITLIGIFVFIILLMPSIVSAQPVFKTSTDVTLRVPCTINGTYCSNSALCYGTVLDPFNIDLLNGVLMTKNGSVFELPLNSNQTSINGEYQLNVVCSDQGNSIAKNLIFFITPNGEIPSTAKGLLYGGLLFVFVLLMILSLYLGFRLEHIALKTGSFMFAYILFIGVTFISWNLSLDYLTSAPFLTSLFHTIWLILMIGAFPLIIFLFIYTLWMMRQMDIINNLIDKGMPIDEAYSRTVKSGFSNRRNW